MENYKLILKDSAGNIHECKLLPENINGLKIKKTLRLEIPIGFTIEASIDSIRIVGEDKEFIQSRWEREGINTDIAIELMELNDLATQYVSLINGYIDFKNNFECYDYYLECGIVIDSEKIQIEDRLNGEFEISPNGKLTVPNRTESIVRYEEHISLNASYTKTQFESSFIFDFAYANKGSKIYSGSVNAAAEISENKGAALLLDIIRVSDLPTSEIDRAIFFEGIFNYSSTVGVANTNINSFQAVFFKRTKINNNWGVWTQFKTQNFSIENLGNYRFKVSGNIVINYNEIGDNSQIYIANNVNVDIITGTNSKTLNIYAESLEYNFLYDKTTSPFTCEMATVPQVMNKLFGVNKWYIEKDAGVYRQSNMCFVSGDSINEVEGAKLYINGAEFIRSFCILAGMGVIYKEGKFNFVTYDKFLSGNVIEISDIKNFSKKYSEKLSYFGLSIGADWRETDISSNRNNPIEILTFDGNNKAINENLLDATIKDLRLDSLGFLVARENFVNSKESEDKSFKDIWAINSTGVLGDEATNLTVNILPSGDGNYLQGVFNTKFCNSWLIFLHRLFFRSIFGRFGDEKNSIQRIYLSSQQNIESNIYNNFGYEKDRYQDLERISLFTPIEIAFTTAIKISDINAFDEIRVYNKNENRYYDAIISDIETTDRLQEVKITAILKG